MNEELNLLKERADRMGISYHPSIGVTSLKGKIAEHMGEEEEKAVIVKPGKRKETIPERNQRLRKEANVLVRIRLTNMNPAKKAWPGEIVSVSNSAIGCIKKFIPFNADAYHIPQVLLSVLQEKMFQTFYTVTVAGQKVKRSKLTKEFAIEILPFLTQDEMKELARKQAMNKPLEG